MRKRILVMLLVVTTVALVAFGVPLGASMAKLVRERAVLRLEREASRASLEVGLPLGTATDPSDLPQASKGTTLALYDSRGSKVYGDGPAFADAVTTKAGGGAVADGTVDDDLVVAVPMIQDETVVATVRAATPRSRVVHSERLAIGAVTLVALIVLGLSGLVAKVMADRLAAPVTALVAAMGRLRDGDLGASAPRSGIEELDAAAIALDETAARFGRMLERERAFSADVSHQLRTPLAAVRLNAEAALADPDASTREARLQEVVAATERLERTVVDLLSLVRSPGRRRDLVDVRPLVTDLEATWHGPLAAAGRRLTVRTAPEPARCRVPEPAVTEILAVLLANALTHGGGAVDVQQSVTDAGALVIEVRDEGRIPADPSAMFRREPRADGHGIGLGLARTLAEAEGARLLVDTRPTTCFRLLLPAGEDEDEDVRDFAQV